MQWKDTVFIWLSVNTSRTSSFPHVRAVFSDSFSNWNICDFRQCVQNQNMQTVTNIKLGYMTSFSLTRWWVASQPGSPTHLLLEVGWTLSTVSRGGWRIRGHLTTRLDSILACYRHSCLPTVHYHLFTEYTINIALLLASIMRLVDNACD